MDGWPYIMRGCTYNPDDRKKGNDTREIKYSYVNNTLQGSETVLCDTTKCNNFSFPRESAMSLHNSFEPCLVDSITKQIIFDGSHSILIITSALWHNTLRGSKKTAATARLWCHRLKVKFDVNTWSSHEPVERSSLHDGK
ncbi:hypothetical protein RvY_12360 [Ramazzottius varieornatus]|uniref:Uncharacterized protein n=1 Tax=Ramazzottius varieornatus TaxID=947166 RepID=A0A1D1VJ86_RAMVA|nr:hypothetical protein RvY_12360 [Ramazzottius varieornatus]